MLRIDVNQAERIAQLRFVQQLEAGLARCVPEFASLPSAERAQCLADSLEAASACGLRSEQGFAAYALAAAHIGPGFERDSPALTAVLAGGLSEARRIHALNAWTLAFAGSPADLAMADAAMNLALQRTAALESGGR